MLDPRELALLSKAQRVLAEASTIDEVKDLRDKAAAVKAYAEKSRLGKNLVIQASAIRIRAERRLGQMLQETPLADSAPGNQHAKASDTHSPAGLLLKDLGITKNESSRSQRIADLPDSAFERYLADCLDVQRVPTFAGLLRPQRADASPSAVVRADARRPSAPNGSGQVILPRAQYSTVLAIPPWPGCTLPNQPDLTTDALCELPLSKLFERQAHLYIWTSSRFLFDGFDVMDAWGFAYRASFVCAHEDAQSNNPWDDAHHLLLLGTQGNLAFREKCDRSWRVCERPPNGLVPDEIRCLIETVSPGPYLQLFGNGNPPNADWTVYPTTAAM